MPTIDSTRGVLVIRIVYDGPAMSGKTTSLRALAQGVGSELVCPDERDGRTLFFEPEGPGFVRLTVTDAAGAADSVLVRLQ